MVVISFRTVLAVTLSLLVGSLLLVACKEEVNTKLSDEQQQQVTQLYADSVRRITPLLDSLCTANYASEVQRLADSLYTVRRLDFEARYVPADQ